MSELETAKKEFSATLLFKGILAATECGRSGSSGITDRALMIAKNYVRRIPGLKEDMVKANCSNYKKAGMVGWATVPEEIYGVFEKYQTQIHDVIPESGGLEDTPFQQAYDAFLEESTKAKRGSGRGKRTRRKKRRRKRKSTKKKRKRKRKRTKKKRRRRRR
jgi:hypothetical protein